MDFSGTLLQFEPTQSTISQTISWTDADSLTLEQICQDLGILETRLDPILPQPPAQFQADELRTPRARPRKDFGDPKNRGNQKGKKKDTVKPILGRINAPRLPNGLYQKLQPLASLETRQSESTSPTTSSMAVDTTWTSVSYATFTSAMMSCTSTIPTFYDLASLIYSFIILDHLKSNSNIELNFRKGIFSKFNYPKLIWHCPLSRLHINNSTL